jgi:hypothetical protein
MKIKIDGRSFIYPDSDIEWFDSLGNVKYKLMDRIVRSRPNRGDKFEPDNWENFNKTELKDKTVWVSKSRNSHHNNFEIEKKVEVKKDMVKIKSGGKWHEYPDDQIKSWDSEGNIEWSDKIHWKFLRGRPSKGDEFVYDEARFIRLSNKNINKLSLNSVSKPVFFDFDKFKSIDRDKLIKIDGLTILIKSFMRPECVNNLLMSIRMRYDIKIIIIDDSENPLNFDYDDNIKTYNIEFDSGLSAGRNFGVSKVKTPYFLLCDDDFEFTDNTDLVNWLEIIKNSDLDILGGDVIMNGNRIDYFGLIEKVDDRLYYRHGNHNINEFYTEYDLILNFFIAKTKKIKKYKWNDSLKLAEHTAFFFEHKGKLKIAHTKLFSVNHQQVRDLEYSKYRVRAKEFFKKWMNDKDISELINFKGEKIKI